jgi:phage terminase large subunit
MSDLIDYAIRVATYFKDIDGERFILTPGQQQIFRAVFEPSIKRAAIRAVTQYGKSEVASMALVCAAVERKEKILIIAPSANQASIIMGKVIDHFFDNPLLTGMLQYTGSSLERLKQERSKSRLTIRNGSEIRMLTAEVKTVSRDAKGLMGFGATIVLSDESSLIPDSMFSKILRMVGGYERGKLIQLGNPFESNHFQRAFESPRYEKIVINKDQALKEGRITQEFLEEAKEDMPMMDWLIFYECEFPKMGAQDSLIPRDWVELAVNQPNCGGDHKQVGLDVARFGGDKTVYVYRKGGEVKRIEVQEQMDTMEIVGWMTPFLNKDQPEVVAVDVIGIGSGVFDRLEELNDEDHFEGDLDIEDINVGEAPTTDEAKKKFMNLRAQLFWNLRELFRPDKKGHSRISIPKDEDLKRQIWELRYKYSSERKIKIEAKEEMKKRLGMSPDKGDALGLAFFDTSEEEAEMVIAEA